MNSDTTEFSKLQWRLTKGDNAEYERENNCNGLEEGLVLWPKRRPMQNIIVSSERIYKAYEEKISNIVYFIFMRRKTVKLFYSDPASS